MKRGSLVPLLRRCRRGGVHRRQPARESPSARRGRVERFVARATSVEDPKEATSPIDIMIERWSTEKEFEALSAALTQHGPDTLLPTLQTTWQRAGIVMTPGIIGAGARVAAPQSESVVRARDHHADGPPGDRGRRPASSARRETGGGPRNRVRIHPHRHPFRPRRQGHRQDRDARPGRLQQADQGPRDRKIQRAAGAAHRGQVREAVNRASTGESDAFCGGVIHPLFFVFCPAKNGHLPCSRINHKLVKDMDFASLSRPGSPLT